MAQQIQMLFKLRQGLLLLLHIIIALEGGIEGRTFRQSSSVSITLDFMHACRFVMSSPISASCETLGERARCYPLTGWSCMKSLNPPPEKSPAQRVGKGQMP